MKKNVNYIIVLFLLLLLSSCSCWNGRMPQDALCTKDAETLEKNYIDLKGGRIEANKDTRAVDYKFKSLQHYFCYVEDEFLRLGYDLENSGIRVYYGAKKDTRDPVGSLEKMSSNSRGYFSTIFFVPIIDTKGLGNPEDYEIIYEIAAFNYGSSRRPPKSYSPDSGSCPLIGVNHSH